MKYARRATLVLAAMAFTLLLTTTVAFAIETWSSRGMYAVHPPRGEFVTVRGARMNVICRGEATPAAPALVFQAGIAGGALDRLPLMDVLDDSYRVCAFDRFGQDLERSGAGAACLRHGGRGVASCVAGIGD